VLSQQFLSVKDVADLLKLGEAAVRSWIKHGDLRAVDVGREWRIAPHDLESFLQQHANRPPDDPRESEHVGDSTPFGPAPKPALNRRSESWLGR
jgi:excisionase family DNA binding protein